MEIAERNPPNTIFKEREERQELRDNIRGGELAQNKLHAYTEYSRETIS
jgi:hypothetical protein